MEEMASFFHAYCPEGVNSKYRLIVFDDKKEAVRQYLIEQMHCKIRGRDGHEGVYLTSKSSKTVQLFLSAIKGFYKTMSRLKKYTQANPLIDLEYKDSCLSNLGKGGTDQGCQKRLVPRNRYLSESKRILILRSSMKNGYLRSLGIGICHTAFIRLGTLMVVKG